MPGKDLGAAARSTSAGSTRSYWYRHILTHLSYRLQVVEPEGHEGIGVLSSILRRYPKRGQPAEQQTTALVVLLVSALVSGKRITHATAPRPSKGFVCVGGLVAEKSQKTPQQIQVCLSRNQFFRSMNGILCSTPFVPSPPGSACLPSGRADTRVP